ncbi:MAG TPA: RNA-binding cell elongation regulator Jag/EloR [Anaerolineales bacterium]|nr:RNA-binding cell elongation regulator Jag/EloR [Anaerolineales bacterium]
MPDSRPNIEIIAPTVEEAVARGAEELGVPPDRLLVEVIDEGGGGVLGLSPRQARVRLTLLGSAGSQPPSAGLSSEPEPDADEEELDSEQPIARELQVARETVQELISLMGLEARVFSRWGQADDPADPRPVVVDVMGDDLSLLIGRRGESLAALQYITRLIVGKELGDYAPIIVDVEGYRARREKQLRQLARRMADQATERGRTMTLEPMTAAERRIIHLELRDHQSVYTESVGEGDQRKVTIIPRRGQDRRL